MRRFICWLKAIPFLLRAGEWVPHSYNCQYDRKIIISTQNSFRVSDNYQHTAGETVHKDACLITYTCKHCGHKTYGWIAEWSERWKYGAED